MKFLALLLVIYLFVSSSISACFGNQEEPDTTYVEDSTGHADFTMNVNARVKSEERIFDKNDVTLDFYYSLYYLDDDTIEQVKEEHETIREKDNYHIQSNYAIYLSNNYELIFNEYLAGLQDLQDISDANAQLYKHFTYEEAFSKNYGYTHSGINIKNYNHSEKLTIPSEYFNSSNDTVYIYIVFFYYNVNEEVCYKMEQSTLRISYELTDDNKVVLK